jgi:histidinol-phosphate aminotransferase
VTISRRNVFKGLAAAAAFSCAAAKSVAGMPLAVPSHEGSCVPVERSTATSPILLDHNENAYGPSEKVRQVLAEAPSMGNRYPHEEYELLRSKLATLHAVQEDHILLGCGSSEILRMAATALTGLRKGLVQALPTYATLGRFARSLGAEVTEIPLTHMVEHDLNAMLKRVGDGKTTGLVYICNPNNPTATLTVRKDIEAFIHSLPATVNVLIDEAYTHFVNPHIAYSSFLDQPIDDPRVIVCRTFSKVYGLAGMRIGYAVAAPETLKRLEAGQLRYGISRISAKAAIVALADTDYVSTAIQRNTDDRQEFMNQANIRMLKAVNSHTNFALLDPLRPAAMVLDHLKHNNVLVAPLFPKMEQYIRVSFGVPDEMREFWRVMDLLPPTGKMAM